MPNKSNHGKETRVLRKLGMNEAYQLAMYILDQYRGTSLSCRYTIPPRFASAESRPLLEEAFKVAVVYVIRRHPALQVGIIDATSKNPSWIQLKSLDLTQHIKWLYLEENDDFEQTVQNHFRTQLDDLFPDLSIEQPGWKITLIRQGHAPLMEALLTWNHPQFDAMGAKIIHEDLLSFLNAQTTTSPPQTSPTSPILPLPLPPSPLPLNLPAPIESLLPLPITPKFLATALWEDIHPQFLNRDPSYANWCPIVATPYKTQYRSFSIPNPALSAILSLCRQNKTTITALLNGLALIAFSSRLDSKIAPAFQSSTVMDHRRNLPPAPEGASWGSSDRVVGNYVTQLIHVYDTELVGRVRGKIPPPAAGGDDSGGQVDMLLSEDLQREVWAVTVDNRQQIVDKMARGMRNDLLGAFKFVADWQKTMAGLARKKRQFTWLVTNIGVLDGRGKVDGDGDGGGERWSISRAQFGLSAEIPAAAIEFSPVSVAGQGMVVGAQWPDCAVDVAFGEAIMGDMERWLGQLASLG